MQQPAAAPPSADCDDVDRKAKLLALLDRARVNRGLQPERQQHEDAPVGRQEEEAMDVKPPDIKAEPIDPPPALSSGTPHFEGHLSPNCTCSHIHQSSAASTPSSDAVSRIPSHPQGLLTSREKNPGHDDTTMTTRVDASAFPAPASTGSSRNHNNSHSRVNSEASEASFSASSMTTHTASRDTSISEAKDVPMHGEADTKAADLARVAVLSSIAPKPRIADLTGGSRERVPRLQQLKPLVMSRASTHHTQPDPREEKLSVKREIPPQTQTKQLRKNAPPTNTDASLKKLAALTPDEYEDSELHGDFQHMLHILIPCNATTALLERRGQPIQSISQQAGCTLSIREPEASPFKDDRLLRIYGKAKCISLAQRLIVAYIRAYRADKSDPNYMDISDETPPVALPATSITKVMSVAVAFGKKGELEITSPFNWMVQREEVGKMMGRQGSTLASIRRDTGASIHIDEDVIPGTTERRVVLGGSVESIAAAVEEIKSRSGGHPEVATSVANRRLGQYFAIPYYSAGYLIGPQGSTVKHITERTGARLQIPSAEDLPLGSVNRILHMQGNPKQTEHARRVVGAKLRDYLASSKCPRTVTPSSTGRKGDKVTIKVLLPSRICGFMLDQRGKLIREVSEKSGAYTHFLAPHDDENRVIAGDVISSKRIAPPRKRKRSQRYEDEEESYAEVAGEDEHVDGDELYYENEMVEDCYDDEYEEDPRLPVRRQTVRRQPLRRPPHEYEEEEDMYMYDDGADEVEYKERSHRPMRRRSVATHPREYIEDEYAVDEYDHDDQYDIPRRRPTQRPTVLRRQPVSRPRFEYDEHYDECEAQYAYADDSDDEYEQSLGARNQMGERRTAGSRPENRRRPVVRPGRKVQMVVQKSGAREGRPRMNPTRRTNGSGSVRPSSRGGSVNTRHTVPRGGRGNGRPNANRGRGNGNKRRRQ